MNKTIIGGINMSEEEIIKMVRSTKEELIEWLFEMYRDEKVNRDIIEQYEQIVQPTQIKENDRTVVKVTPSFQYYKKGW